MVELIKAFYVVSWVVVVWMIFAAVIGIGLYIITSMSLYRLAKNNNLEDKAILAWVPFANLWLISLMVKDIIWQGKNIPGIALIVAYLVINYFKSMMGRGVISILFTLLGVVIIVAVYYEMYRRFRGIKHPVVISILSAFIPLVLTVMLFINKDEKLIPKEELEEIDYREVVRKHLNI